MTEHDHRRGSGATTFGNVHPRSLPVVIVITACFLRQTLKFKKHRIAEPGRLKCSPISGGWSIPGLFPFSPNRTSARMGIMVDAGIAETMGVTAADAESLASGRAYASVADTLAVPILHLQSYIDSGSVTARRISECGWEREGGSDLYSACFWQAEGRWNCSAPEDCHPAITLLYEIQTPHRRPDLLCFLCGEDRR